MSGSDEFPRNWATPFFNSKVTFVGQKSNIYSESFASKVIISINISRRSLSGKLLFGVMYKTVFITLEVYGRYSVYQSVSKFEVRMNLLAYLINTKNRRQ